MSTKIYNGYRLKANSLDEALEILQAGKPALRELYAATKIQENMFKSVNLLVGYFLQASKMFEDYGLTFKYDFTKVGSWSALSLSNHEDLILPEKENLKTRESRSERPSDIRIVLLPGKQHIEGENYYLFVLYADSNLSKVFSKCYPQASFYPYWNNTDKPPRVTNKDWNARSEHWDAVFKSNDPAQDGMTLQFVENDIEEAVLDPKKRTKYLKQAVRIAASPEQLESIHKQKKEVLLTNYFLKQCSPEELKSTSTVLKMSKKARGDKFTPEEQLIVDKTEKALRTLLPEKIDYELLTKPLNELTALLEKAQLTTEIEIPPAAAPSTTLKKKKI